MHIIDHIRLRHREAYQKVTYSFSACSVYEPVIFIFQMMTRPVQSDGREYQSRIV